MTVAEANKSRALCYVESPAKVKTSGWSSTHEFTVKPHSAMTPFDVPKNVTPTAS
jgi:hypothetical protein